MKPAIFVVAVLAVGCGGEIGPTPELDAGPAPNDAALDASLDAVDELDAADDADSAPDANDGDAPSWAIDAPCLAAGDLCCTDAGGFACNSWDGGALAWGAIDASCP